MTYGLSKSIDNCISVLADVLQPFMPTGQIVRGQTNRVPLPSNPCMVLTELFVKDIQTPRNIYDGVTYTATVYNPRQLDVQIDFYGENAGDMCSAVCAFWRSDFSFQAFPEWIKPLWANDGIQSPLVDDENQWQSRWSLTVHLQYNPSMQMSAEFAESATVAGIVDVDVNYPV